MESGVLSCRSSTCHHEIVFAKLNLKFEYPSSYERVFWDYSRKTQNNLFLNIYASYIPNKAVLCDEKDPSWMNNGIRAVIEMKGNA